MLNPEAPKNRNLVLSAFEAIIEARNRAAKDHISELTERHAQLFVASPCVRGGAQSAFDRFSIADPSIRVGVAENTAAE